MSEWHLCPICKLGNPYDKDHEGPDCLDIMAHGANWVTEDPDKEVE